MKQPIFREIVVNEILEEFVDKIGFGKWWFNLNDDIRKDIFESLKERLKGFKKEVYVEIETENSIYVIDFWKNKFKCSETEHNNLSIPEDTFIDFENVSVIKKGDSVFFVGISYWVERLSGQRENVKDNIYSTSPVQYIRVIDQ